IQQGSKTYQPQYGDFGFTNTTTGDPNNVGTTGNSLASALLGYPATNGNTPPTTQGNRVANYAGYAEDAWTISRSVTFTYGLRADHRRPFAPIAGSFTSSPATDGIWWIGMNALPGACAVVGQQPCIPSANGTLAGIDGGVAAVDPDTGLPWYNAADPPIQLSPYGTAWGADGGWDYGPRLGVAWRFNSKTTIRGGAGFAYDATQGIDQDWKANAGQWPANGSVGGGFAMNTTVSTVAANGGPQSYTTTLSTVQKVLPASDPWSLNSWYTDPHIQDPRSLQYNLTIERELGSSTALSVAYVGSRDDRLAITGQWNTALTPGNGTASEVRARTPFPGTTPRPFTARATDGQTTTPCRSSWRKGSPTASSIWLTILGPRPSVPAVADCLRWRTGRAVTPFGRTTTTLRHPRARWHSTFLKYLQWKASMFCPSASESAT
ncbi:MAG: hypothetical protein WBQ02_06840, partial [Terracidiphilus sp.]